MTAYIDERLSDRICAAGDSGQIEGMIVVKELEGSRFAGDVGLARRVIEGAVERAGERPGAIRYFPRANAAVISASGRLIQEMLKDEHLAVATATDVDVIIFPIMCGADR